jgi:hypothetical protein
MLERTRDCVGFKPRRLAADAAYGSGLMIEWLMRHQIEPHILLLVWAGGERRPKRA